MMTMPKTGASCVIMDFLFFKEDIVVNNFVYEDKCCTAGG